MFTLKVKSILVSWVNTLYFCWPGFFSVRLQCSFPCLTAEIFSFMTDTKQNTIYKWPDRLWVDVLFWKTLKEVTACKLFSACRPSESWPGSWGHCQSSTAEQDSWQTGGILELRETESCPDSCLPGIYRCPEVTRSTAAWLCTWTQDRSCSRWHSVHAHKAPKCFPQ